MSVVTWSSPVRRHVGDDRELVLIPNEIYFDIFDYIKPGPSFTSDECCGIFSRIALVCRFFCSVALPILFASISFRGDGHEAYGAPELVSQLLSGQKSALAIAAHVHDMRFDSWQTPLKSDWARMAFFSRYVRALPMLSSLTSVTISASPLTPTLIRTLAGIPSVRAVSLDNCRTEGWEHFVITHPPCHWTSFRVSCAYDLSEALEILVFLVAQMPLIELVIDDWVFARSIFAKPCAQFKLECLSVPFFYIDRGSFLSVLERSPTITSLTISALHVSNDVLIRLNNINVLPLPLPRDAIPRLRHLASPVCIAQSILNGRRITTLDLRGVLTARFPERLTSMVPPSLDGTSSGITELKAPCEFWVQKAFHGQFSDLRNLTITVERAAWDKFIAAIRDLSAQRETSAGDGVQELELDMHKDDWANAILSLEWQRFHLRLLAGAFPAAKRIQLGPCIAWERQHGTSRASPCERSDPLQQRDGLPDSSCWSPFVVDRQICQECLANPGRMPTARNDEISRLLSGEKMGRALPGK